MLQLCDLLEAYLNWKLVEKVFWTWMVSLTQLNTHISNTEHPRFFINVTDFSGVKQRICFCVYV